MARSSVCLAFSIPLSHFASFARTPHYSGCPPGASEDKLPRDLLKGFCILLERGHASFVTVEPEILILALVSLFVLLVSANQF